MKIRLLAIVASFILAVWMTNCSDQAVTDTPADGEVEPSTPTSVAHGGTVLDYGSLVDSLRAVGASVEPAGQVSQPFFSVKGQLISLNTESVQVFEYPDADIAGGEATAISEDRFSVIEWVATPHFYKTGKLIVLYVGDHAAVIDALEAVLGSPFATGSAPAPDTIPATYEGVALPGGGGPVRQNAPPLVWLIVGYEAVPAIPGSYTVSYPDESAPKGEGGEVVMVVEHADAIAPTENPDLAIATLPPGEKAVILISSGAIGEFTATAADWTDPYGPSERRLQAERTSVGNLTVFTLEPIGDTIDRLVAVSITFDRGDASYFWRLNPTSVSRPDIELPAVPLKPLATAARISFLGWSPDVETLPHLEHIEDDLAVLSPRVCL